jgi:hypothetical protein
MHTEHHQGNHNDNSLRETNWPSPSLTMDWNAWTAQLSNTNIFSIFNRVNTESKQQMDVYN